MTPDILQARPPGERWDGPHFRPLLFGLTRFTGPLRQHPLAFDAIEPEAVWIMTLRGHAFYETAQQRIRLEPGRVLVALKPNRNRLLMPPAGWPWVHLYVHMTGECALSAFRYMIDRFGTVQTLPPDSGIVRKTRALVRLATSPAGAALDEHAWSARAYDWFQTWWSCAERHGVPLGKIVTEPPGHSRLIGLQATTVKGFAGELGYSPSHLSRRLNRFWGNAPGRALRQARLEEAARLLRTTRLPVEEIAARVGYRSPSSFIRAFRLARGHTPLFHRHAGK